MKQLVLLRHGESSWNQENRFTGWTNVDLTEKGKQEAQQAGKLLKEQGFIFDQSFTSYLKRAIKTLNIVLDEMDQDWIPVSKSWRLNEKHYGDLQGLNKAETAKLYGEEQVLLWRRSYDTPPQALDPQDPRAAQQDLRYQKLDPAEIPLTESLKDCVARTLPYWEQNILQALKQHDQILVVAHGNSLRGIVKIIKNLSNEAILELNIPTGVPYLFTFDEQLQLQEDYFL